MAIKFYRLNFHLVDSRENIAMYLLFMIIPTTTKKSLFFIKMMFKSFMQNIELKLKTIYSVVIK